MFSRHRWWKPHVLIVLQAVIGFGGTSTFQSNIHISRLTIIRVQFYLRRFFVLNFLSISFVSMTHYIDNVIYIRQFCPLTCVCTQYSLRMKALGGDITRYSCFQVIINDLNVTIMMDSNYITFGHYRCTYGYHMCLSLVSSDIHISNWLHSPLNNISGLF